jgi:hypothetical protein
MTTHDLLNTTSPVSEGQLTAEQRSIIADILARQARDPRVWMSRAACKLEGDWKDTTQLEKELAGYLHVVRDGGSVKISTASFYAHLIWIASQAPRKIRQPPKRYTKKTRPRSEAELCGLAAGNAKRRLEAQRRRAEAEARRAAKESAPT